MEKIRYKLEIIDKNGACQTIKDLNIISNDYIRDHVLTAHLTIVYKKSVVKIELGSLHKLDLYVQMIEHVSNNCDECVINKIMEHLHEYEINSNDVCIIDFIQLPVICRYQTIYEG